MPDLGMRLHIFVSKSNTKVKFVCHVQYLAGHSSYNETGTQVPYYLYAFQKQLC